MPITLSKAVRSARGSPSVAADRRALNGLPARVAPWIVNQRVRSSAGGSGSLAGPAASSAATSSATTWAVKSQMGVR